MPWEFKRISFRVLFTPTPPEASIAKFELNKLRNTLTISFVSDAAAVEFGKKLNLTDPKNPIELSVSSSKDRHRISKRQLIKLAKCLGKEDDFLIDLIQQSKEHFEREEHAALQRDSLLFHSMFPSVATGATTDTTTSADALEQSGSVSQMRDIFAPPPLQRGYGVIFNPDLGTTFEEQMIAKQQQMRENMRNYLISSGSRRQAIEFDVEAINSNYKLSVADKQQDEHSSAIGVLTKEQVETLKQQSLCCPISLMPMTHPVKIVETDESDAKKEFYYDKEYLIGWINQCLANNLVPINPLTRQPIAAVLPAPEIFERTAKALQPKDLRRKDRRSL